MTIDTTNNTKGRTVIHRGQEYYARLSDVEEPLRFRVQFSAARSAEKRSAAFIGFNSFIDAAQWINANRELSVHEITRSEHPEDIQRVFLDIDAKKSDFPGLTDIVFERVYQFICESVYEVLSEGGISNPECAVLKGSHAKKFGIHLIYKFAYIENACNKCFIEKVKTRLLSYLDKNKLDVAYLSFVDEAVYKKNGSLRVHLSPKPEDESGAVYKLECEPEDERANSRFDYRTLITYMIDQREGRMEIWNCVGCKRLEKREPEFSASADLPEKMQQAYKALEELKQEYGITVREEKKNGIIELWSNHTKPCYVCGCKHDSDHPFAIVNNGGVFLKCRRSGKKVCLVKFESFSSYEEAPAMPVAAASMPAPELFHETTSKYVEGLNVMMNTHNTVYLRSDLGSGKSHAFSRYVADCVKLAPKTTALIVTYRINLAAEILAKNPGFESYSALKSGCIRLSKHPMLIIQYESLNRLWIDTELDICFIDEGVSLLQQTESGLNKKQRGANLSQFENLMSCAKKLLVCDALLTIESMRTFNILRNDPASVFWLNNGEKWRPHVQYVDDVNLWRIRLFEDIKNRIRVFVTTTHGEVWIRALEARINELTGGTMKILTLYGGKETNEDIMADINGEFSKYDIVIASPCISAGISFDVPDHFSRIYSFIDNAGPTSVDIIQSFRRVRHSRENKLIICDMSSARNLPCTYDDVLRFEEKRLYENCEEFRSVGVPTRNSGMKSMFTDPNNITLRFVLSVRAGINRARRSIKSAVRGFLAGQNATFGEVLRLSAPVEQPAKEEKRAFTKAKKLVKSDIYAKIAEVKLVDENDYEELKKCKRLNAENKAMMEKYQLSRKYKFVEDQWVEGHIYRIKGLWRLNDASQVAKLMNASTLNTYYNAQYRELTIEQTTDIDNKRLEKLSDVNKLTARFITKRHILIERIRQIVERGEKVQSALIDYLAGEQKACNPELTEYPAVSSRNVVRTANDIVSAYGYFIKGDTNQNYKFQDKISDQFTVLKIYEPISESESVAEKPIIWLL